MTVYLGADHGGFELKEALKKHLDAEGYKVIDLSLIHISEPTRH